MLLTKDSLEASKIAVFLDGKWVRAPLAANDEEGWVEIPDIAAMAPIDLNNSNNATKPGDEEVSPWERIKTIKKYGKVEFKKLP